MSEPWNLDEASHLSHPLLSLTRLTIGNCDQLRPWDIVKLVGKLSMPKLEYLKLKAPMNLAMEMRFGCSLLATSNIRHLCAPMDFLDLDFWTGDHHVDSSAPYTLDTLELDQFASSEGPLTSFVNFDTIFDVVSDGHFGNLRKLNLHRYLVQTLGTDSESDSLNDYLKALAREDEEGARYSEDQAGIWLFGE